MSKFTTEVRYICETYANDPSLTIEQTIEKAAPYIFNDTWNTADPDHKKELEQKILRYYYTREIGYETVGLWKFRLNTKLSLIIPKYNVLYSSLSQVKEKLLSNVDITEERSNTGNSTTSQTNTGTSNSTTELTGKNDGTQSSTSKGSTEESSKQDENNSTTTTDEGTQSSTNKTDGTSHATSDAWSKYADTPQGALNGLQDDTYMSNANHNLATSDSTQSTTTDGSGTSKNTETTEGTTSSTGSNTTTSNGEGSSETHNTASSTTTEKGDTSNTLKGTTNTDGSETMHMVGKNNGTSYIDEYLKLAEKYNDIDLQVINELEPLFMGLWE